MTHDLEMGVNVAVLMDQRVHCIRLITDKELNPYTDIYGNDFGNNEAYIKARKCPQLSQTSKNAKSWLRRYHT